MSSDFSSAFNSPFVVDEAHIPMQLDAVISDSDVAGPGGLLASPFSSAALVGVSASGMASSQSASAGGVRLFPTFTVAHHTSTDSVSSSLPYSPQCDGNISHNDDSSYDSPSGAAEVKPEPPAAMEDDSPAGGARKRARKAKAPSPPVEDEDDSDDDGSMDHLSKRERNKLSAAKYRKRRKVYLNSLEGKVQQMEKVMANKSAEVTALKEQNRSLVSKVSVLEEQLSFLKSLLGPAAHSVVAPVSSNGGVSKSRGAFMFVLFAAFLLVLPFSSLKISTVPSSAADPFDHSVNGHRGRIILSLPETADWWHSAVSSVSSLWPSVLSVSQNIVSSAVAAATNVTMDRCAYDVPCESACSQALPVMFASA